MPKLLSTAIPNADVSYPSHARISMDCRKEIAVNLPRKAAIIVGVCHTRIHLDEFGEVFGEACCFKSQPPCDLKDDLLEIEGM